MKLIDMAHSPYSARVRLQGYLKGIELELEPPQGLGTEQYKAFNTLGKVPVLDTGELMLPESIVIMDYLEDIHPQPPLRPADPLQRAVMNIFYRYPDVYIQPLLFPLFQQLSANPRDDAVIARDIAALESQLKLLDELLERYGRDNNRSLDLADCALLPIIFYAVVVPRMLNGSDILAEVPLTAAWWQWAGEQEAAARVLQELEQGLLAFSQKG